MQQQSLTFEQAMARIEEIVRVMERGDRPMDEAMSLFEEGTKLIRACSEQLSGAEQQIVKLMKGSNGEVGESPFKVE
ncbi:MAG: exodeoxyribonuclease VII small subunit [Oscillospiraceae bacterium]|jgi:exodeoxyribonuclease VII small subunit|nr:exodeoxyribonuclease VII small subunit [Oscillospiraceae bacterium]